MNAGRSKLIFWTCLLATATHFAMLLLLKFDLNKSAWLYVYPYFDQQWSLFAPPPQNNARILLILKDQRRMWLNYGSGDHVLKNELERQALNNSIHYLLTSLPANPERMREDNNFILLENFVQSYLAHRGLPEAVKTCLVLSNRHNQKVIAVYSN